MKKEGKNRKKEILFLVTLIFLFLFVNIIFAQEDLFWCCVKSSDTTIPDCQDVPLLFQDCMAGQLIYSSCDRVSECDEGCCINNDEGICTPKNLQKNCVSYGDDIDWIKTENGECSMAECNKGCCVLGNDIQWVTEKTCEVQALIKGVPQEGNFDGSLSIADCFAQGP